MCLPMTSLRAAIAVGLCPLLVSHARAVESER